MENGDNAKAASGEAAQDSRANKLRRFCLHLVEVHAIVSAFV